MLTMRDSDRVSRRNFPSQAGRSDEMSRLEHLFTRDAALGILPIGGSSRSRPGFKVTLVGDDKSGTWARWMTNFFAIPHAHYRFQEAYCDFVETAAGYLAYEGEVFYEIVRPLRQPADQQHPAIVLEPLPIGRVFRVGSYYLQMIPRPDRDPSRQLWIKIAAQKIWHLKLPRILGSPASHRRFLRSLRGLAHTAPDFALSDMRAGTHTPAYTFQRYRLAVDTALAKRARRWGRPVFSQNNGITEYYQTCLFLRHSYAQAVVREHIVGQLSALLARLTMPVRIEVAERVNEFETVPDCI